MTEELGIGRIGVVKNDRGAKLWKDRSGEEWQRSKTMERQEW